MNVGSVGLGWQDFWKQAHEQYCVGSAVANITCRKCGELFVHMQARRLRRDVLVGSRFVCPLTLPGVMGQRLNMSSMSTTRIVGATLFATVRRAAHETGCRFCRWCDKMFHSAANRARHERLCPDQPQAAVVDVGP